MIKKHIYGLDILRGFCALLVAAYHVLSWNKYIEFSAVGRYGVYIFFVLSGFSIHYQYRDRINSLSDIKNFIKKRFFRLFPLLLLTVVLSYFIMLFRMDALTAYPIIMTLSLLFGFSAPAITSAVTGGWSLGIEFAFYIFYPVMLAFLQSSRQYIVALFSFFMLKLFFTNYVFSDYYITHVNELFTSPLSFVFYFIAGCYFAELYIKKTPYQSDLYIFLLPVILVLCVPFNISGKEVLTGMNGAFFTLFSCVIVWIYALYEPKYEFIKKTAKFLGDISYGVYLLHPLIYFKFFKKLDLLPDYPIAQCLLILATASILAKIIKKFYEDPFVAFLKNHSFSLPKTLYPMQMKKHKFSKDNQTI